MFTPARRRGVEILDDPSHDPVLAVRSLHDVAKANLLFGGRHAVLREVRRVLARTPSSAPVRTLLDIGTGIGDIPASSARAAHKAGVQLRTLGLEITPALARAAQPSCTWCAVGDALALPFADSSIDIVTCSQVLHHFDGSSAERLLRECARVAREAVVIADLRRSWLAVGGLWLSSFLLGFHPVSRNDGIVSILRGYTLAELRALVTCATGAEPVVRHSLGWRVTAVWMPARSHSPPHRTHSSIR
ncbi:MAG: methyltransferase domain-containing protein [Gemmatimonas sp.]